MQMYGDFVRISPYKWCMKLGVGKKNDPCDFILVRFQNVGKPFQIELLCGHVKLAFIMFCAF